MIQIRTADWRNQTRSRTVLNPLYKEAGDLQRSCGFI